MVGNFSCFCRRLLQNHLFSKYSFSTTARLSNSLDPDQDRRSVGPDLDPNRLQRLSAGDTSREGVVASFERSVPFVFVTI